MKYRSSIFLALLLTVPVISKAQSRSVGLRTGIALWHGTYENFTHEKAQRQPIWEKEVFIRRKLGKKWVGEVSLGHRKFREHYQTPGDNMSVFYKNVRTNSYSLGLAFDYALCKKSATTCLYAGWGFMLQHVENYGEEYGLRGGNRIWDESSSGLEDIWMCGPQVTGTHRLSGRFSGMAKAGYLIDISPIVNSLRDSRSYDIRGCLSLSVGASYAF